VVVEGPVRPRVNFPAIAGIDAVDISSPEYLSARLCIAGALLSRRDPRIFACHLLAFICANDICMQAEFFITFEITSCITTCISLAFPKFGCGGRWLRFVCVDEVS
jgi:hypothetical protein